MEDGKLNMNRKISIFCSTFVISGIIIYSAFDLGENKSPSIFYKDSSAKVKNNITTKNTSEKSRPSIETMSNEYILNTSSAEDDLQIGRASCRERVLRLV